MKLIYGVKTILKILTAYNTIYSGYIPVWCKQMLHIKTSTTMWKLPRLLNSERRRMSCTHGCAMECLSWVIQEILTGKLQKYNIISIESTISIYCIICMFSNKLFSLCVTILENALCVYLMNEIFLVCDCNGLSFWCLVTCTVHLPAVFWIS